MKLVIATLIAAAQAVDIYAVEICLYNFTEKPSSGESPLNIAY